MKQFRHKLSFSFCATNRNNGGRVRWFGDVEDVEMRHGFLPVQFRAGHAGVIARVNVLHAQDVHGGFAVRTRSSHFFDSAMQRKEMIGVLSSRSLAINRILRLSCDSRNLYQSVGRTNQAGLPWTSHLLDVSAGRQSFSVFEPGDAQSERFVALYDATERRRRRFASRRWLGTHLKKGVSKS